MLYNTRSAIGVVEELDGPYVLISGSPLGALWFNARTSHEGIVVRELSTGQYVLIQESDGSEYISAEGFPRRATPEAWLLVSVKPLT